MTPEVQQELDEHIKAIAKLLYADVDASKLQSLSDIEVTVREQIQTHVTPPIGVFLSKALQANRKDTPAP